MSKRPESLGYSRQEWIAACHFHDLSHAQLFAEIEKRVGHEKKALVLLDLDGTLYDVAPRTLLILREWISSEQSAVFLDLRGFLSKLDLSHIGYSLGDIFLKAGLDRDSPAVKAGFESAKAFWQSRFFSSAYLPADTPYPGASSFVNRLYELGAELIYLTGRDEGAMGEGTRANLRRDGFPWDPQGGRTSLLLKPSASMDDLTHKQGAAEFIRKRGRLVASFENEPKNTAALALLFPEAMHVFVDTYCSDHEAAACQGLYRIGGFTCQ